LAQPLLRQTIKVFPRAEAHVYPDFGHNFLWEDPADVGRRLAGFFAGQ